MKAMMRIATLALLALLSACGTTSGKSAQQSTLSEYAAAIRWGEFDRAQDFVDPVHRQEHPITDLDRERFKHMQVSGYEVKHASMTPDGGLQQTVEIRVINKLTQSERTLTDRQTWRWDEAGKRLWLTSGLPDFSQP
ncbi:hypothetical protein [Arenimonas sp.]|uniref:hypothetical protein n=1 Tax=Arenimonas sp. TaxID=1872635 RepID=UPI0039E5B272